LIFRSGLIVTSYLKAHEINKKLGRYELSVKITLILRKINLMKSNVSILLVFLMIFLIFPNGNGSVVPFTRKPHDPPPRIIRTCCAFGSDLKISGIPFKRITEVTSLGEIGAHVYLGGKKEGNGIIYTEKGGFIDLGHLRDIADWTRYLSNEILSTKGAYKEITLGREGGKKTLNLWIPADITKQDAANLAGRIAYDLSVWHEIGTWFGTSFIPFVPERYSAFSPEDQYSNLTGAVLGVAALNSEQPFELAMTGLVDEMLTNLKAVDTREKTLEAMEAVVGDWWTRDMKLPSKKVLIKRYVNADSTLIPWVLPNTKVDSLQPVSIPAFRDDHLAEMYEINFKLNRKFPIKEIFPDRDDRCISQNDFPAMMAYIEKKTDALENEIVLELDAKQEKKKKRAERRDRAKSH